VRAGHPGWEGAAVRCRRNGNPFAVLNFVSKLDHPYPCGNPRSLRTTLPHGAPDRRFARKHAAFCPEDTHRVGDCPSGVLSVCSQTTETGRSAWRAPRPRSGGACGAPATLAGLRHDGHRLGRCGPADRRAAAAAPAPARLARPDPVLRDGPPMGRRRPGPQRPGRGRASPWLPLARRRHPAAAGGQRPAGRAWRPGHRQAGGPTPLRAIRPGAARRPAGRGRRRPRAAPGPGPAPASGPRPRPRRRHRARPRAARPRAP